MSKHNVKLIMMTDEYSPLGQALSKLVLTKFEYMLEALESFKYSVAKFKYSVEIKARAKDIEAWLDLLEEIVGNELDDVTLIRNKLKTNVRSINLKLLKANNENN